MAMLVNSGILDFAFCSSKAAALYTPTASEKGTASLKPKGKPTLKTKQK
jgi:hypothetical protein